MRHHLLLLATAATSAFAAAAAIPAAAAPLADLAVAAEAADADVLAEAAAAPAITVTATRAPTPAEDVPAIVTVIDAEQIADLLASDVRDLVRFEPGITVRRAPSRFGAAFGATGRDGNAGFNIRGLEGNRVLIQVDGIRIPDGFEFGAQAAGRGDYVDLGLVRAVEILRGPASALYGSDGLAGAISFLTSDPEDVLRGDDSFGGHVRTAYDSADQQFSHSLLAAGRSGDWSALIAYTRRDGEELDNRGTVDVPNLNRTTPNPQDTRTDAILGKLVWAPDARNRFRLTAEYNDNRIATNVLSGVAANPARPTDVIGLAARDEVTRSRISLDWRHESGGWIEFLQASIWYQDGENRQFAAEDRLSAPDRTRLNTFENRVVGAILELRSRFETGPLSHRLVYGVDGSITRQAGFRDGTVPPVGESFPARAFPVTDFTLAGAFLSDQIELGPVTLHPALRFDHYALDPQDDPLLAGFVAARQSGSRVSPKFGVVVKIADNARLFGNYAQGFRAPSPTQVNNFFFNPILNYTSLPNPDLRPEISETWEAGLRLGEGSVTATLNAFTGRYRNFINQELISGTLRPGDPGVFQFVNLTRVSIDGAEARLDARAANGLTGRLAIAYATGDEIRPDGSRRPLITINPLNVVAGLGWRDPGDRFGGELILTHSARKAAGRAEGLCTGPCFRPPAFTILDATAYARIGERFILRAGLFNLTDERYAWWADVRGLPASSTVTDAFTQPGRNVSVSLTARF